MMNIQFKLRPNSFSDSPVVSITSIQRAPFIFPLVIFVLTLFVSATQIMFTEQVSQAKNPDGGAASSAGETVDSPTEGLPDWNPPAKSDEAISAAEGSFPPLQAKNSPGPCPQNATNPHGEGFPSRADDHVVSGSATSSGTAH